jgi:glycerophosphoryl diester phosphodiesterase
MRLGRRLVRIVFVTAAALAGATAALAAPNAAPRAASAKPTPGLPPLETISEHTLPSYQAAAMLGDAPLLDLQVAADGNAWVAGHTSVWLWHAAARSLTRFALTTPSQLDSASSVALVAPIGSSLFAATRDALFQIDAAPTPRVLRFAIAAGGKPLALNGDDAQVWLVQGTALYRVDRATGALAPVATLPALEDGAPVLLSRDGRTLWTARKNVLQRIALDEAAPEAKPLFKSRHEITAIRALGGGLLIHTRQAVLRLDARGHLKQSIPVEGRRMLVASDVTPAGHAYVFDDHLLEIYRPATRSAHRYRLPLDDEESVTRVRVGAATVALMIDGRPRLFHLGPTPAAAPTAVARPAAAAEHAVSGG